MLLTTIRAATNPRARIVRVPDAVLYIAAVAGEIVRATTGERTAINRRRYAELTSPGFACRVDRLRDRLGVEPRVDLADGIQRTAA